MTFPNWRTALLAHPAEAASNMNTAEFLTVFGTGSIAATRTTALTKQERALIIACSTGESKLHLYHNFLNFGRHRTCSVTKLAVLEGLGPLEAPFLLPASALDLASCRVPELATPAATTTTEEFCKATAGQKIKFCNTKFVVCLPWMAKAILG